MTPDNKRRHPRVDVLLKVSYASHSDFLADYSSNASESGLFIATNNAFQVGEQIEFDISFPILLESIRCKAVVRWVRTPDQANEREQAGMGVAFVFDDGPQEQRIRQLVAKLVQIEQDQDTPGPERTTDQAAEHFRVLLVEDNPLVREMLRFAMKKFHRVKHPQRQGLELHEAEDGRQALDVLKDQSFDIAIIDYYMPVMDGGQLIRHLRADSKHSALPIIVVSVGGEEARQASYAAGANLFVAKPLVLNQLFDSLHKLLALAQA